LSKGPKGWRIAIKIQGRRLQQRFPASTPQGTVEIALHQARERLRAKVPVAGSFRADVARYLEAFMHGRRAYEERERHLELWRAAFGPTTRHAITREAVSKVLHGWLAAGLSPETCNKRRAALAAFFSALDGKGGQNPVREVPKFKVPAPLARGLPYAQIKTALKTLRRTKTRARLKVMAYTGARPSEVMKIRPEHWDDRRHTLILHGTAKGHGTKPRVLPLSPDAQTALREFENADAWGAFTLAPMGRVWKAAAIAAKLPASTTVYDLRHSFGTELYRVTGDLRIVKELMGHSSMTMTERYTLGAVSERSTQAVQAFGRSVGGARRGAFRP
jgi:integrase